LIDYTTLNSTYTEHQTLKQLQNCKINTENRYWILKAIGRIRQSGLFYQWDKWSTWSYSLLLKQLGNPYSESLNPDYIDAEKLFAIFVIWRCLLLISLIVFSIEVVSKRF